MLTSIVILTYNKLNFTIQCIESIRKYTHKSDYELIVVDNHSTDGTVEWLKEQNDIKCIFNEFNAGFPRGCNQGIEAATGDNILLLNNDVIATENWLQNLVNALYSDPTIGAVGPVTNSAAYYSTIPVSFNTFDEMQSFAKNYNITDSNEWEERVKLIGFCLLIKREVIEKVGLLDELFSPGNFEDDDYSFRIQLAGYKLLICKDTFIYHYGSQSWKEKPDEYYSLLKENEHKFSRKWGFNPSYSTFIRNEIINLIEEPAEKKINVLEVGCACGATLVKIKNKYKYAEIHGIELNENAAEIAKLYANVTDQNIENAELKFKQNYFDYIIFADVLEHLYDPWKVLTEIKKYLKADGKVLISIPNVMHFSLLKQVINGTWTYSESGLLDRTHVRFFTLHEIIKALEDAGYRNVEYQMITVPKTSEDQELIDKLCELSNDNLKQQYEAYQYIIKSSVGDELEVLINKLAKNENEICSKDLEEINKYEINQVTNYVEEINISKENKIGLLNLIAISNYQNNVGDRVLPFLEKAFVLDKNNKDTIYNIAFLLNSLGEYTLAQKYVKEVKYLDHELDLLNQEIESNITKKRQKKLLLLVRRMETKTNFSESVKLFLEILKKEMLSVNHVIQTIKKSSNNCIETFNMLAQICFQENLKEFSLPFLIAAYEEDSEDKDTLFNLGLINYELGLYKQAQKYLESINEADSEIDEIMEKIKKSI